MKRIAYSVILCLFFFITLSAQKLTNDDLYITYGNSLYVKSIANMQLVTEKEYNEQLKHKVNFLNTKSIILKKQGKLTLPCSNEKSVTYADNMSENENHAEYKYIGQIDFLNVYVISYTFWESSGYLFVDKSNGEELDSFEEFPHIAKDRTNMVVLKQDPYEMSANIAFYKIEDREFTPVVSDNFEYWVPYSEKPIFWSNNNSLYIPAIHVDAYNSGKELAPLCQYIKVSIIDIKY